MWLYGTPGVVARRSGCCGYRDLKYHIRRVVKLCSLGVGGDTHNKQKTIKTKQDNMNKKEKEGSVGLTKVLSEAY